VNDKQVRVGSSPYPDGSVLPDAASIATFFRHPKHRKMAWCAERGSNTLGALNPASGGMKAMNDRLFFFFFHLSG
jgi:streptogramin lyase